MCNALAFTDRSCPFEYIGFSCGSGLLEYSWLLLWRDSIATETKYRLLLLQHPKISIAHASFFEVYLREVRVQDICKEAIRPERTYITRWRLITICKVICVFAITRHRSHGRSIVRLVVFLLLLWPSQLAEKSIRHSLTLTDILIHPISATSLECIRRRNGLLLEHGTDNLFEYIIFSSIAIKSVQGYSPKHRGEDYNFYTVYK